MLDGSLINGAVPVVLAGAGAAGLLMLVAGRGLRWWLRVVMPLMGVSGALVAAGVVILAVLRPFPDAQPAVVWWAVAAAVVAVGLAVTRWRRTRGPVRRVGVVLAAALVVAAGANQVNQHFGQYPTVRSALGMAPPDQLAFSAVTASAAALVAARPGQPLARVWRAPAGIGSTGVVAQVVIPGRVSGFAARPGWVYLPPAYLVSPRARLPVLVLLSGQPGSPGDWLGGGRIAAMMDRFAAAHGGLAPVVVIADWLGAALHNTLCLDSRLGHAQTYLSVDVPAWVQTHLQVDPDPRSWAVAGSSAGGTCALQLAVNAPTVYPTFIDLSGQSEPTLGDRRRTVAAAFGGDTAAFTRVNPLDVLAAREFPATAGTIIAGASDATYRPEAIVAARAARAAGMHIEYRELPGGHSWQVWGPGLASALPWLATRTGLTP